MNNPNNIAKIQKTEIEDGIYLIDVEQRTPEWIELRKHHITATDAPRLIKMFVDKQKYYGMCDIEFFDYKHDINQKPRDRFSRENMAKGSMMEDIAEKHVESICVDLTETSGDNSVFTYKRGIVITRFCWLMSSYDFMIYKNGKIFFPVEVKHTDSENVFKQFADINHCNYYQLAFQMVTCKAKSGMLLFYTNSDPKTAQCRTIDESSKYCKDVKKHINSTFKEIWTDVCKNKVNPCRDKIKVADDIIQEVSQVYNSFEANEYIKKEIEKRQQEIHALKASMTDEKFFDKKKKEAKDKLLKHMKDNDIHHIVRGNNRYTKVSPEGKKDYLKITQNSSNLH